MRRRAILLLFAAAVFAGNVKRGEGSEFAPEDVEGLWSFSITSSAPWEERFGDGAEVLLLSGPEPVHFVATLVQKGALPAQFKLADSHVHWSAERGKVAREVDHPIVQAATWVPPDDAEPVRVTAEITLNLVRVVPGTGKNLSLKKKASLLFLPAVPSAKMKEGKIEGFEIGHYLNPLKTSEKGQGPMIRRHAKQYQPPAHYYRVSKAEKPLHISKHFTLGQFMIDFPWGTIGALQYVAYDPILVQKLEALIERMESKGEFKITTLVPIYGFRPPSYNMETIREHPTTTLKKAFSMHQYGRAYDFIIDEDGDLRMDDLNHDGKCDVRDAAVILKYVNEMDRDYLAAKEDARVGGAGVYENHDFIGRVASPYLHLDTRGYAGDGGTLIRWKEPAGSGISVRLDQ